MATAITKSTLTRNTGATVTRTAATADTDNLAETFTFTPSVSDEKIMILINNVGSEGDLTYSISAGAAFVGSAAVTGTVAQTVIHAIVLDCSKCKDADGLISVVLTPGTDDKLLTEHAATVAVIQLP